MQEIERDIKLKPFVKAIYLLEGGDTVHSLPFYADGYPGLMYSECDNELIIQPSNKKLTALFLYGQTIEPIEIEIKGTYKLIVFQLYPFATRLLLDIDPREINDECFDLYKLKVVDTIKTLSALRSAVTTTQVKTLSAYILQLVKHSSVNLDNRIKLAVSIIINSKGTIQIKELRKQLFITERTFERKFTSEIGVTPKRFAKIVQFSFSLNQLQESDYYTLTDIAFNNNFSDQSHFIKTFKKYSGQTPREFSLQIS